MDFWDSRGSLSGLHFRYGLPALAAVAPHAPPRVRSYRAFPLNDIIGGDVFSYVRCGFQERGHKGSLLQQLHRYNPAAPIDPSSPTTGDRPFF